MAGAIDIGKIKAGLELDGSQAEAALAKARIAISAFKEEIGRLNQDLSSNGISRPEHAARVRELTHNINDLAAAMQASYSKIGGGSGAMGVFAAQASQTSNAMNRAAGGVMNFAYMIDDLQYGLQGAVNNIGPLVLGLTGNAGMAAAAQIAAVGVAQLASHWDQLAEAFGDTSGAGQAVRSVEAVEEAVKKLKATVGDGGWAAEILKGFGVDVNGGLASKLEGAMANLEGRMEAEKAARKMDGAKTEEQQKAEQHFGDAVMEAGGIGKLSRDMGAKDVEEGNAQKYLSRDRGRFFGPMRDVAAMTGADIGDVPMSDAEEYQQLRAKKQKDGKLAAAEQTQLADLEAKARIAATAAARQRLGAAALDPAKAQQLADDLGRDRTRFGDAADLISGRKQTQREVKEAEKDDKRRARGEKKDDTEEARQQKAAEKEADRQARRMLPGLGIATKQAAIDRIDKGESTDFTRDGITSALIAKGMPADQAKGAAQRAMDHAIDTTDQGDVDRQKAQQEREKARKREAAKREERDQEDATREGNDQLAHMLIPGLDKLVDRGVAEGRLAGMTPDQQVAELSRAFQKDGAGMAKEDADTTAKGMVTEANAKLDDRVAERQMEGFHNAFSQVFDTTDLNKSIQATIGTGNENTEGKKTNDLLGKLVELAQYQSENVLQLRVQR